jgi:RimJ/RimL family protein N-acetyltransferase
VDAFGLGDDVVRLRPVNSGDVDEWLGGQDDEEIREFEFPRASTRADVVGAVERWMQSWRDLGPLRNWAVCDARDGRILGGVEVRDIGNREVNLSYVVFPPARGQGIATRAAKFALRYAAAEMDARVAVLKILEGNEASLGVARHIGAKVVGREPSERGGVFVVHRLDLEPHLGLDPGPQIS